MQPCKKTQEGIEHQRKRESQDERPDDLRGNVKRRQQENEEYPAQENDLGIGGEGHVLILFPALAEMRAL
jgi:hypothetical protein